MMKIQRHFFCILLPILSAIPGYAGQWEQVALEVQAKPVEPFVEAAFHYEPAAGEVGKAPKFGSLPEGVKLLPNAGSAALTSEAGAAQKESMTVFRFQIPVGCLSGEHTILLPLAGISESEPKELKVILNVPEWVEIKPRRLIWKKGEAVESKVTSIVSVTREGVVLTKVESSDDAFDAILERQAAQLYTVKITPKDITKPKSAVIRVIGTDIHGQ